MKKVSLIFCLLFNFSQITFSQTVTIGKQVWMTKNLDVSAFRNGDPIPHAKTLNDWVIAGRNKQPAWCYYSDDPNNNETYGKLYNWYAVNDTRGLAPTGWHVPSDEEWTVLTDYLGGAKVAGTKMKSKSGWANDGNGTDSIGFSGVPGGFRAEYGTFLSIEGGACWWSSTDYLSAVSSFRFLSVDRGSLSRSFRDVKSGLSVRCLRD